MAETLISPGVLARENDQSQITSQPIQAGAALIGPTVKGRVNIPKLITSYSEYQANFGTTFESGSTNQKEEYTFLTSISAYNYFQNGGTSLIVTRVASGSFTAATSSTIFNDVESGDIPDGTNVFSQLTVDTGNDGLAGQYDDVSTTGGDGSGLKVNVTATSASGQFSQSAIPTVSAPTNAVAASYLVSQSATSGAGSGATFAVTCSDATTIDSIRAIATGSGYATGDTLTVTSQSVMGAGTGAGGADLTITIGAGDLHVKPTAIVTSGSVSGYAVGNTITVAKANIGNADTDLTFTLVDADITDANAFTLETIGQGEIMNNAGTLNSQGAISTGTNDNLRWEIASPNTSSGTFSVIIRRGNDTTRAKSVLESFNNVSLDPKASNYISRIIGDQTETLLGSGTSEPYLQTTGSYPNASRYVRVKSVNFKTPDYLDNSGTAKSQFTASIPVAASGTFGDAQGSILTGQGKYYQEISGTDTQGLVGGNYTDAINLLANKDDYQYNIISVPGLYQSDYSSTTNTLISNTEDRGDNIIVLDLEAYNSSITATTTTAASLDTSYAAAYWPWCMVTDPDSGQRVWVPASTLIPGVYAANDRTAEAWFAPAGINRGGLGVVVQAERKLTQSNRDTLYVGKVNPIATFPGRGVVVFGQKTLQTQASALDRVNVRRLLIALKNFISQISDNLVFEQNTAATRNVFLGQVNPYLESVQQRQGLYAFKVVMNDSNNGPEVIDRNELRGAIYIQPTKTAEFIYLDFNILPTGAEFPA
jgi:phage tail sheath protein FI